LQVDHHADDVVVGLADRQIGGNVAVDRFGLQVEAPPRVVGFVARERNPFRYGSFGMADDVVQKAARLARVAGDFGDAVLVVVELFEGHDRQEDVVFLETEQAGRVVHQNVGVQNEEFRGGLRFGAAGRHGFARSFGCGTGLLLRLF